MPLHKTPLNVRPPYPDSTPPEEPYSPSLLESPAFDLTDLPEAQQAKRMARSPSTGSDATATGGGVTLPESLRIGAGSSGGAHSPTRGSAEMWQSFKKDEAEIPESLRPGGGMVRAKSPVRVETYMHGATETDPEVNPWMEKGDRHAQETEAWEERHERALGDLPAALLTGGGQVQEKVPASFPEQDPVADAKSPMSPESDACKLLFFYYLNSSIKILVNYFLDIN